MITDTAPHSAPPAAPRTSDAIDAWLDRLVRLVRFRPRHAREIRDELDGHLRERVRDLMLAGHDEAEAIHRAISELGDLALLARRYREAQSPHVRRLVMHTALIALAGAGFALGAFNLTRAPQPQPQPEAEGMISVMPLQVEALMSAKRDDHPLLFDSLRPESIVQLSADTPELPLNEFLAFIAAESGGRPYIYWADLAEAFLTPDKDVGELPLKDQSIDRAFTMASDILGLSGQDRLDYRLENGLMEVARGEFFDRRERRLTAYDASTILPSVDVLGTSDESETLINLLVTIVEPEAWPQNGGDLASIYAVGQRLFVNAPPRIHESVAWVLDELRAGDNREGRAGPAGGRGTTSVVAPPTLEHMQGSIRRAAAGPTGPWIFALTRTSAADAAPIVESVVGRIGGQVAADPRGNSVLVSGDRVVHDLAAMVLAALDSPQR